MNNLTVTKSNHLIDASYRLNVQAGVASENGK